VGFVLALDLDLAPVASDFLAAAFLSGFAAAFLPADPAADLEEDLATAFLAVETVVFDADLAAFLAVVFALPADLAGALEDFFAVVFADFLAVAFLAGFAAAFLAGFFFATPTLAFAFAAAFFFAAAFALAAAFLAGVLAAFFLLGLISSLLHDSAAYAPRPPHKRGDR